jgi:hypothetical protein
MILRKFAGRSRDKQGDERGVSAKQQDHSPAPHCQDSARGRDRDKRR